MRTLFGDQLLLVKGDTETAFLLCFSAAGILPDGGERTHFSCSYWTLSQCAIVGICHYCALKRDVHETVTMTSLRDQPMLFEGDAETAFIVSTTS